MTKTLNTLTVATLKDIITIDIDEGVESALKLMKEHRIHHLPVIEEDELVGMLSTRDIERALLPENRLKEWNSIRMEDLDCSYCAGELMSWPVQAISINTELADITEFMLFNRLSSVILTHEDGRVAGIISQADLLKAFANILKHPDSTFKDKLKLWLAQNPLQNFLQPLSNSGI